MALSWDLSDPSQQITVYKWQYHKQQATIVGGFGWCLLMSAPRKCSYMVIPRQKKRLPRGSDDPYFVWSQRPTIWHRFSDGLQRPEAGSCLSASRWQSGSTSPSLQPDSWHFTPSCNANRIGCVQNRGTQSTNRFPAKRTISAVRMQLHVCPLLVR